MIDMQVSSCTHHFIHQGLTGGCADSARATMHRVHGASIRPEYDTMVSGSVIQSTVSSILTENEMQVRMAILPEIVHEWC